MTSSGIVSEEVQMCQRIGEDKGKFWDKYLELG